jgi:HAD superfamily hydrolase (TIGR01549 family)
VRKHLVPQANSLAPFVDKIDFVLPEYFKNEATNLHPDIRTVILPFNFAQGLGLPSSVAYTALYKGNAPEFEYAIASLLEKYLGDNYDAVLLWETPVPFLQSMFPTAAIVHQMPGIFSRPPYPHTVVFDPIGLYRSGTFHLHAKDVQSGAAIDRAGLDLARNFCGEVRRSMSRLQPIDPTEYIPSGEWQKLELLPLQTSGHYTFICDTPHENQFEFALDALGKTDPKIGLIATQYVTPHARETPFNRDVATSVSERFPNFLYHPELEKIESVSQFLLPLVDGVVCASSSLGIQAMAWHKTLRVLGPTFLENYDSFAGNACDLAWEERCDNTIATILSRHQPLASAVTQDGTFLRKALEDIISRKVAGKVGLDLLPDFEEIDRGYPRRLMEGFRVGATAKSLSVRNPLWTASHRVQENFRTLLEAPEVMAISFDVFDTLIRRPVEKPADLLRFLDAKALKLTGGVAADFGRTRTMCEVETRNRLSESKDEITLDDIYETLAVFFDLTEDQILALKSAEIELEITAAQERPFGRKLYDIARATGRPIYLISDMYLPACVIEQMLAKAGYDDYQELFVSSEYGCRKHSGDLYDVVLNRVGLAPRNLLHVGDNKRTDIEKAEARGIRAFRWSSAIEWMRSNPIYEKIYAPRVGAGEKARSAIAGVTALGLFDAPAPPESFTSLSGGQAENLGYAVLGPIVTGYMTWLGREARRDAISDLYFMAREGWVLKEAFNILHEDDETLPKGKYLYGSRRAIRLASCRNRGDIMAMASAPYDPGISLDGLLHARFGIDLTPERAQLLAKQEIHYLARPLERSFDDQNLWRRTCRALTEDILENAAVERGAYEHYLAESSFYTSENPALVDLGWKANIQGALGSLTSRSLTGYYYATLQDSEIWLDRGHFHRCYAGQGLSPGISNSGVVHHRRLMEFLLCHSEPTLTSMKMVDGRTQPVFRPETEHLSRRVFIDQVHRGVLNFVRNYRAGFAHVTDQIYIDPALAEMAFHQFARFPVTIDARLLLNQSFEDAVGGIPKKYIISPNIKDHARNSVWKVGAQAAHASTAPPKKPANLTSVVWPVATVLDVKSKRPIEQLILKSFLSDRKHNKYLKDRAEFFTDSRSNLLKAYYRITAGSA